MAKEGRLAFWPQQYYWQNWQFKQDERAHQAVLAFELKGELNKPALEKALTKLLEELHNESWPVSHEIQVTLEDNQLSDLNISLDGTIKDFVRKIPCVKLNLEKGPIFFFRLVRLNPNSHLLHLTFHRIILDWFSENTIIARITNLYNHFAHKTQLYDVAPLVAKHINLQYENSEFYWLDRLANQKLYIDLPVSYLTEKSSDAYESYHASLTSMEFKSVVDVAEKFGVPPEVLVLFGYAFVLSKYSNRDRIIITQPINLREPGNDIIGSWVNFIPCLFQFDYHLSWSINLRRNIDAYLEDRERDNYPILQLLSKLKNSGKISNLDYSNVSFIAAPVKPLNISFKGINAYSLPIPGQALENHLNLCIETNDLLQIRFDYRTALFEPWFIEQMTQHLLALLRNWQRIGDGPISALSFLKKDEHEPIKGTTFALPPGKTVIDYFKTEVRRHPVDVAVEYKKSHLTYQELDQQSDYLARVLFHQHRTIPQATESPPLIVGVYLNSCLELPVSILAVLKAGGTYVPIDPSLPEARVKEYLDDGPINYVITSKALNAKVLEEVEHLVFVDSLPDQEPTIQSLILARPAAHVPAYTIYTSGTTGKPKGVTIHQYSIINFVLDCQKRLNITDKDHFLSIASISFDMFTLDLFVPLLSGAKFRLVDKTEVKDPKCLAKIINQEKPSVIHATPTYWSIIEPFLKMMPTHTRWLSGGETLSDSLAEKLLSHGVELWNYYGPTEATVYSSCQRVKEPKVTLGKPISNTELYILDKHGQVVPKGVPGELYIGGKGVAKEYHGMPELTETSFVEIMSGDRLYRTGDRVKATHHNELIYLGRMDNQIKLRGFRIELEEIESVLESHQEVQQAIVIQSESKEHLYAYYLPRKRAWYEKFFLVKPPSPKTFHQYVSQSLPEYMVPLAYVPVNDFPYTVTHKIDKSALPVVEEKHYAIKQYKDTPYTMHEYQLRQIWQTILHKKAVGVDDDFFYAGGHSLLAVKLMTELNEHFDLNLPVSWCYQYRTIKAQANNIESIAHKNTYQPMVYLRENADTKCPHPLFLLPPSLTGAEVYDQLAEELRDKIDCYGLEAYNLYSGESMINDLPTMASYYVEQLQKVQAKGPYFLAGWSFGGFMAFEIAQQLIEKGEEIAMLFILDTYQEPLSNYQNYAKNITKSLLLEKIAEVRGSYEETHFISRYFKEMPDSHLSRICESTKNDYIMLSHYHFRPIEAPVHLIKATQNNFLCEQLLNSPHYHWDDWAVDIGLSEVDSHHYDLIFGQAAKRVSEIIEDEMLAIWHEQV